MRKQLKIGVLSQRDAKNKRAWSGSIYYMSEILKENLGDVVHIGPYEPRFTGYFLKALNKISYHLLGKNYNIAHSRMIAIDYARVFGRMIKEETPDLIIAIASTPGVAYLKTDIPIIVIDDITFTLLKKNYSNYTNLLGISERESEYVTDKAYKRADAVVFSSDWAAQSAIDDNNLPPEKVHVISFGANLDRIPKREEAVNKIAQPECRLLFLGVDWKRKGGDIAYAAFLDLVDSGFKVVFTVCGCVPPPEYRHPQMKIIPFLDKNNPEDFEKLYKLLTETNYLLIPTRNDCTPIVFSEANSFGIPVITTDVGGVSAVITEGVNGFLLGEGEKGSAYADVIMKNYGNKERYKELVTSSRNEYETRLNWNSWSLSMKKIAYSLLKRTADNDVNEVVTMSS